MKRKGNVYPLQKIAEHAGVSTATVSRAINRPEVVKAQTREKVLGALKELEINPDALRSAPVRAERKPVILHINRAFDDNQAGSEFNKGIMEVAQRQDYICLHIIADMLLTMSQQQLKQFLAQTNTQGVLAMIPLDTAMLSTLAASVPVVQIGDKNNSFESCIVTSDFYKGASETVNHLIAQSCSNIAAVLFDTRFSDSSALKKRAYCDALHRAGLPVKTENIIELSKVDFFMGINAVSSLLKHNPDIDGMFCGTDLYAVAALSMCQQYGINVPGTVKIAGYDDTIYSSVTFPKLTTTRYDRFYAGYMGCELLIKRIQNPSLPPETITLENELIIRGSTMNQYWEKTT